MLATELDASLAKINSGASQYVHKQSIKSASGPNGALTATQDRKVVSALRTPPRTRSYVAVAAVPGLGKNVPLTVC